MGTLGTATGASAVADTIGTLRGIVTAREDGAPLGGVTLLVDTGATAVTDERGAYLVEDLPLGAHEAYATGAGRVRQRVRFDTALVTEARLDFDMQRGGVIRGTVLDPEGRPVPGARVRRPNSGHRVSLEALYETCDEDGRFTYDGIPFDAPMMLGTHVDGYRDDFTSVTIAEGRPAPPVVLRLSPAEPAPPSDGTGRTITGQVLAPDGAPVPNATVRTGGPGSGRRSAETQTDDQGRFAFAAAPGRDEVGLIVAPEFAPVVVSFAGAGADGSIRLDAGCTVRGRVVDDTGSPLTGVNVFPSLAAPGGGCCGRSMGLRERMTTTGTDGRFEIGGLPSAGAQFAFLRSGMSDLRGARLAPGREHEITMQATGAVHGRVLDADGRPVEHFRIRVTIPDAPPSPNRVGGYSAAFGHGVQFTRADGSFVVTELIAGHFHGLVAETQGGGRAVVECVEAVPLGALSDAEPVTLRLEPGRPLRVRVVDGTDHGEPIADAVVAVIRAEFVRATFRWGFHDGAVGDRGRTAADGSIEFDALPDGGATIVVRASGRGRRRVHWSGEREMVIALAPAASVHGIAVDANGRPLASGGVALTGRDGDDHYLHGSLTPDDEGRFRFDDLAPGVYVLTCTRHGQKLLEREIVLRAGEAHEVTP